MADSRAAAAAAPASLRTELPRFIAAGVLGLVIDIAVLYGALALGMGFYSGRLLSFVCAVFATWRFNRRYTFSPAAGGSVWREWWMYFSAMLLGGAVNYAAYTVVIVLLRPGPWLAMLAVAIGSLSGMTVNFLTAKFLVFRRPS